MAVPYFQKFPRIPYAILGDGIYNVATNLIHRARFREVVRSNSLLFQSYIVRDGESPEMVAYHAYGDTKFHWLVLYANDIIDPYYDWVWSYDDFLAFIVKKYEDIPTAHQTIHHYEDIFGNEIDETSYDALPDDEKLLVNCYDYWLGWNESKRRIQLIDRVYLEQIDAELDVLMRLEE